MWQLLTSLDLMGEYKIAPNSKVNSEIKVYIVDSCLCSFTGTWSQENEFSVPLYVQVSQYVLVFIYRCMTYSK